MVDEIQTRVGKLRPIHVMDREADDYSLLAKLTAEAGRFIIRINEGRVLEHEGRPPSSETPHLNEALQVLEGTVLRTVVLSRRVAKNKKNARSHASRDRREANLSVRALQVRVQKPYNVKHETKALTLNVVQVFEPSPLRTRSRSAGRWRPVNPSPPSPKSPRWSTGTALAGWSKNSSRR